MKKILFLNPDRGHTCSFYRSGGVSTDLRKQLGNDYTIDVVAWPDFHTDWQSILEYDVVMMVKRNKEWVCDGNTVAVRELSEQEVMHLDRYRYLIVPVSKTEVEIVVNRLDVEGLSAGTQHFYEQYQ